MKYYVTNDQVLLQKTWPAFLHSYERFLGNQTKSTFDTVLKNLSCASVILDDRDEIFAFSFHRQVFCSDKNQPPEYLSDTNETFRAFVENKFQLLTIEWMTVAPERLGKFSKIQPADVIIGIVLSFMRSSVCNAAMGYSRQDIKTDKLTMRFGTKCYGTVDRFGIPCSIVLVEDFNVKSHPIVKTQEKIDELWANRINHLPQLERRIAA